MTAQDPAPDELLATIEGLRTELEHYRRIAEQLPDNIMRYDREYRHIYLNQTVLKVAGFTLEQGLGKTHRELGYPPELCELWERTFQKVFDSGQPERLDFEVEVPAGTIHLEISIKPEYDEQGEIVSLLAVSRDITERRLAELALAASEETYRGIVETSRDLIWRRDLGGHLTYVNPAWERVLGYSVVDLEAHGRAVRADLAQAEAQTLARVVQADAATVHDTVYLAREGHEVYLSFSIVPLRDAKGRVIGTQGTAFDRSAERRAQAELRALEERLHRSRRLESLGALAGGIAHDFNNMLVGILGNADLAMLALQPGSEAAHCVHEITEIADRCARLSHQMLAYSGKGRFVVTPVGIGGVIAQAVASLDATLAHHGPVRVEVADDLPLVLGDPSQLQQLLLNLLLNACEAQQGRAGKIVVRAQAAQCAAGCPCGAPFGEASEIWPPGPVVALSVSDQGPGMPAAVLRRLYDPFFSTKFVGRGLGLSVVHGIARGHQAGILVHSGPQGSRFTLHLRELAGRPAQPQAPTPAPHQLSGTILLVDDEQIVRTVARRVLEHLGFTVVTACDGQEALSVYARHRDRLDCILMDWTMPRMNGREALERLRREGATLPILLGSGYSVEDLRAQLQGAGVSGFVSKPYGIAGLKAALTMALAAEA